MGSPGNNQNNSSTSPLGGIETVPLVTVHTSFRQYVPESSWPTGIVLILSVGAVSPEA